MTANMNDRGTANPDFDVIRAAHAELVVTDMAMSEKFYVETLGLIVSARTDNALYLRALGEQLHHSLVLRLGAEPMVDHTAFRVRHPDDLDALAAHYESLGCTPRFVEGVEEGQGLALRVHDQHGLPLEFFHDMDHVPCRLWDYHEYRGARLQRLDHFNFLLPDVPAAFETWRTLGFRCSEYIADGDALLAAWLFRKPTVHDVALTTGAGPRLHHVAYASMDSASIIWTCEILGARGEFTIERGPGRHGVSNAFFLYLRDPDGHRIEIYAGDYYTGDPDLEPRRWDAADPRRRSFWGSPVPDAWYDEGTLVRGESVDAQPLVYPLRDERLVTAE